MRKIALILGISLAVALGVHAVSGAITPQPALVAPKVAPSSNIIAKPNIVVAPRSTTNLSQAANLVDMAFEKLTASQQANEYDLGGHAQNAKTLTKQGADDLTKSIAGTP